MSNKVRPRSVHYSSTPLHYYSIDGENSSRPHSSAYQYSQGHSQQRENYIAQWVEQTARFSVSSSSTDVSSESNCSDTNREILGNLTLQPEERQRIQNIYNSYRTDTWVSESLVNLYTSSRKGPWTLRYTGVPVLLLDQGGSRCRGKGVRLVLAERGSGLALWFDTLDNLSSYSGVDPLFHFFHCSQDHSLRVGLSWDSERPARLLLHRVNTVMSRPENIGLSGPKAAPTTGISSGSRYGSQRTLPRQGREKRGAAVGGASGGTSAQHLRRAVSKTDISSPVGFVHNVSLNIDNLSRHFSMALSTGPPAGEDE